VDPASCDRGSAWPESGRRGRRPGRCRSAPCRPRWGRPSRAPPGGAARRGRALAGSGRRDRWRGSRGWAASRRGTGSGRPPGAGAIPTARSGRRDRRPNPRRGGVRWRGPATTARRRSDPGARVRARRRTSRDGAAGRSADRRPGPHASRSAAARPGVRPACPATWVDARRVAGRASRGGRHQRRRYVGPARRRVAGGEDRRGRRHLADRASRGCPLLAGRAGPGRRRLAGRGGRRRRRRCVGPAGRRVAGREDRWGRGRLAGRASRGCPRDRRRLAGRASRGSPHLAGRVGPGPRRFADRGVGPGRRRVDLARRRVAGRGGRRGRRRPDGGPAEVDRPAPRARRAPVRLARQRNGRPGAPTAVVAKRSASFLHELRRCQRVAPQASRPRGCPN
jgi:hypothetical protein